MPDQEKVIKGLEAIKSFFGYGLPSVAELFDLYYSILNDAIAMLKEQEAKTIESIQMDRSDKWGADLTGYCPSCKRSLKSRFNKRFCSRCGQAVKWK